MCKKELIVLDAELIRVLDSKAFCARLDNGHELVAFVAGRREAGRAALQTGGRVRVELSPYDMSKGRILF